MMISESPKAGHTTLLEIADAWDRVAKEGEREAGQSEHGKTQ
jgi:hypothetical protein